MAEYECGDEVCVRWGSAIVQATVTATDVDGGIYDMVSAAWDDVETFKVADIVGKLRQERA